MATKLKATVGQIAPGIFRVRWSPRILSICDAQRRKDIVYIGFPNKESADKFYSKVTKRRGDWKWKRYPEQVNGQVDGVGITRPRKSERLTDYPYEVKWHRPPLEFIEGLIRWELGQTVEGHQLIEAAYNNR